MDEFLSSTRWQGIGAIVAILSLLLSFVSFLRDKRSNRDSSQRAAHQLGQPKETAVAPASVARPSPPTRSTSASGLSFDDAYWLHIGPMAFAAGAALYEDSKGGIKALLAASVFALPAGALGGLASVVLTTVLCAITDSALQIRDESKSSEHAVWSHVAGSSLTVLAVGAMYRWFSGDPWANRVAPVATIVGIAAAFVWVPLFHRRALRRAA